MLRAITVRHGLVGDPIPLPQTGMINVHVAVGDAVVRVPRDDPGHVQQLLREITALPLAAGAGVPVPRVLAVDDALDLVPVPYLVLSRLDGVDLESTGDDDGDVLVTVGRHLAALHGGAVRPASWPEREDFGFGDARALAEARATDGWISPSDARWLLAWLDRLDAPVAAPVVVHGDLQRTNVFVRDGSLVALLDWGCARSDEPAADFVPLPLRSTDELVRGYGSAADDGLLARIVWRKLEAMLAVLPRGAAPAMSWGERPVAWLLDLVRFFSDPPSDRWGAVAPPRGAPGV